MPPLLITKIFTVGLVDQDLSILLNVPSDYPRLRSRPLISGSLRVRFSLLIIFQKTWTKSYVFKIRKFYLKVWTLFLLGWGRVRRRSGDPGLAFPHGSHSCLRLRGAPPVAGTCVLLFTIPPPGFFTICCVLQLLVWAHLTEWNSYNCLLNCFLASSFHTFLSQVLWLSTFFFFFFFFAFLSLPPSMVISGDIFVMGGGCYWHPVSFTRLAAKTSDNTQHAPSARESYLAPNINRVKIEKLLCSDDTCLISLPYLENSHVFPISKYIYQEFPSWRSG